MTGKLAPVLLLAGWAALPAWRPHLPAWAERWLYNPRERTERALEAHESGDRARAVAAAETARRLAPEDPRTGFNAGTANLAAGRERRAAKLLEEAAKAATAARTDGRSDPALAPLAQPAWYNLGNAQLGAGDAAAAVEAYKQALRLNPADADAKHNLEIALREREKERMRMQGGRQGSRGDRSGEREQSRQPGEGSPDQDRSRSDARDPGRSPESGPQQDQGQAGRRNQPSPQGGGRLPQFRDQPEMTSREAANLLSAVESLERRQRREAAAKRSREKAAKGKDW